MSPTVNHHLHRWRIAARSTGVLSMLVCVFISACASADKREYQNLVHRLTARQNVNLNELAISTRADPTVPAYRKAIVIKAIEEAKLGLSGPEARRRYDGVASWCAEFARWLYGHCGGYSDPLVLDEFAKVLTSSELEELFATHGAWVEKEQVTGQTVEVGDYLPLDFDFDGSPNHSTIVVYVSKDKHSVYTVDGNDDHGRAKSRVYLKVRPYMISNGRVHPMIDGVGKVWPPGRHPHHRTSVSP